MKFNNTKKHRTATCELSVPFSGGDADAAAAADVDAAGAAAAAAADDDDDGDDTDADADAGPRPGTGARRRLGLSWGAGSSGAQAGREMQGLPAKDVFNWSSVSAAVKPDRFTSTLLRQNRRVHHLLESIFPFFVR